jgi:alpha-ketoglutarate-dependent taurine dioxygenase
MENDNDSNAFVDTKNRRIKIYKGDKKIDPVAWIEKMHTVLHGEITQYGGILLRNFPIESMSMFKQLVNRLHPEMLDYIYRSTPRKILGGKIYTATEYPAHKIIPQHNENSYADQWPQHIIFFCVIPPQKGGRTPLADSRKILEELDPEIVNKFERWGVMYLRNYTSGIDLSWQEVFQSDQRKEVEKYCNEHNIQFIWNKTGPELTTKQVCQSTYVHPVTKEKVWFNQAHLFHISNLDSQESALLSKVLQLNAFPRNSFYGNGKEIEEEVLQQIREVYERNLFRFNWDRGDVLWLDNVLTSHGRESFEGERKIAAAMA